MLKIKVPPHVFEQATCLLAGDAKLAQWFVDQMERRAESELVEALEDQAIVSKENFEAVHRPIDGLGQCTFRMAKKLADWITKWVSPEYVYDEAFIRQLIADNSHMCFKPTVEKKASIIRPDWTPENPGAQIIPAAA